MVKRPVTAAFLAALSMEVQPFLRRVRAERLQEVALPAWEFTWHTGRGVAVLSGMGEAAAARSMAWIFEHYQPQAIISLGFGGAVAPELPPGAVSLGASYWRYEPESKTLEELSAPPSPAWLAALGERLQAAGLPVFPGSMVTTRGIIHKAGHADNLTHLSHPVLDLETGVMAAEARSRNLPFLAIRAITDVAGEEIPDFLKKAAHQGETPTLAQALAWLITNPRRFSYLYRLWRRSRLAALNLTKALEVVLEVC